MTQMIRRIPMTEEKVIAPTMKVKAEIQGS